MVVSVEMRAFGDPGEIREVDVPDVEWEQAVPLDRLNLAWHWGQNETQPREHCSVSVGDVIRMDGKRYMVKPFGFEEVTDAS